MAVSTKVLLQGIDEIAAQIDGLERRAGDLSECWPILGRMWAHRQAVVFDTDGLGQWPPDQARTRLQGSRSTLVRTGRLRRAVSDSTPVESTPHSVTFGVKPGDVHAIVVGNVHRHGGRVPKRDSMPQLRPSEKDEWLKAIRTHLAGHARP